MDLTSAAKLVALSTAFSLGGYHFALSQSVIPALHHLPASASLPTFREVYMIALKQFFLPIAPISLASFSYLSLTDNASHSALHRYLYATSAGLVLGIGLVTKLIMLPGVERLLSMNDGTISIKAMADVDASTKQLLAAFTRQNWLRAACGLTGGVLGLWAVSSDSIAE